MFVRTYYSALVPFGTDLLPLSVQFQMDIQKWVAEHAQGDRDDPKSLSLIRPTVYFPGGSRVEGEPLTELPEELGTLDLTELYLTKHRIAKLPPGFSSLRLLCWNMNGLTSFPDGVASLQNIRLLDLTKNKITSLPPEIGNLRTLTRLYIYENPITHFPSEIGKLANLVEIHARGCRLEELPPEFGNLTNLAYLDLKDNCLITLPLEFQKLEKLRDLRLALNPIAIPSELTEFVESRRHCFDR